MKFQQIRSATVKITYAGKTFLIDPWLAPRYMAGCLVPQLFDEYEIIERYQGTDLVGKKYESLFPYSEDEVKKSRKEAFKVCADSYVTMSDGTGIVHIAPAFGEDDARVGRDNDLPFVQLVKEDGTLPEAHHQKA